MTELDKLEKERFDGGWRRYNYTHAFRGSLQFVQQIDIEPSESIEVEGEDWLLDQSRESRAENTS